LTRELILQGLTKRTHAEMLQKMFAVDVERAILSVAFVSENGVDHIEPLLAPHSAKLIIFAGIRNEITSAQALRRLLSLGVSLYAVDTGSRALLFHPKLYYVRTTHAAKLSVGSANLTLGGLNNNVEASLLFDLFLDDGDDAAFAKQLEDVFDGLSAAHAENVIHIHSKAVIDGLLAAGRVIDETVLPPPRPATTAKAGSSDPTPRMKMQPKPLYGRKKTIAPAAPPVAPAAATTVEPELELVWESKPLSRRSLGIPIDPNSNPTGSTTLGSGTFDHIDRVTYFRTHLFGHLPWARNGTIETAEQAFDLVIKGVLLGTFPLTLRHSLTRAAAAAVDHNSPSGLSWNQARGLVAREDLLNRTMRIWRSITDAPKFRIEID
jgi:HKD family nuclease